MAKIKLLVCLWTLVAPLVVTGQVLQYERVPRIKTSLYGAEAGLSFFLLGERSVEIMVDGFQHQNLDHIVFEVHVQKGEVSLYDDDPTWHSVGSHSTHGRDVGVTSKLQTGEETKSWYIVNNGTSSVEVNCKLNYYRSSDPYPGRCPSYNPNIKVTYKNGVNYVRFDKPMIRENASIVDIGCPHNVSAKDFRFTLYQQSLGHASYFRWRHMISRDDSKVHTMETDAESEREIRVASYPGNRVRYRLTLGQKQMYYNSWFKVEYVGILTSSCPDDADSCGPDSLVMGMAVALGFLGIVMCFTAEKLPELALFVLGYLAFGLLAYISLIKFSPLEYPACFAVSSACGLFLGFFAALLHRCKPRHPVFALLPGLSFAFLASCCIVNMTTLSNEAWCRWLTYHVMYILMTVLSVTLPRMMRILGTSVVGSYLVVSMVDVFTGGSIRQVTLYTINSAIYEESSEAYIVLPWRSVDIILASIWGALAVAGIVVQILLAMKWKDACSGCCTTGCACSGCCTTGCACPKRDCPTPHPLVAKWASRMSHAMCNHLKGRNTHSLSIRADDVIDAVVTYKAHPVTNDDDEVGAQASDTAPLLT